MKAQLHESIVVKVDQPEIARNTLSKTGWRVKRNGSQKLYVQANGDSDAALINRQLLENGVQVFQVNLEKPSLEDIFLSLTEEK